MKTIFLGLLVGIGLFAQYQPNQEFVTSQPAIPTGSCSGQVSTLIRVTTSPFGTYQCGANGTWILTVGSNPLPVSSGGTGSATLTGVATQSIVIPLTLSQLQTLYSVGVQILPQPAATSMYVMGPCVLNLTYGSAAFTAGGAVSIGYGNTYASTTPSPLTHGTIAATVFTTFSASHGVVVIPAAVAVTATTSLAGKAVFMSAATQDFAGGTAGSGQVSCQYSVVTGVS